MRARKLSSKQVFKLLGHEFMSCMAPTTTYSPTLVMLRNQLCEPANARIHVLYLALESPIFLGSRLVGKSSCEWTSVRSHVMYVSWNHPCSWVLEMLTNSWVLEMLTNCSSGRASLTLPHDHVNTSICHTHQRKLSEVRTARPHQTSTPRP